VEDVLKEPYINEVNQNLPAFIIQVCMGINWHNIFSFSEISKMETKSYNKPKKSQPESIDEGVVGLSDSQVKKHNLI